MVKNDEIRADGVAVLGGPVLLPRWNLSAGGNCVVEVEHLAEDELAPRPVQRWIVVELLARRTEPGGDVAVECVEALRQRLREHRDRQERPARFDEREPFCVVASDRGGHQSSLPRSGTSSVIVAGNSRGDGSA